MSAWMYSSRAGVPLARADGLGEQLDAGPAAFGQTEHPQVADHHARDLAAPGQLKLLGRQLDRLVGVAEGQVSERRSGAPGDHAGTCRRAVRSQTPRLGRVLQRLLRAALREPQPRTHVQQVEALNGVVNGRIVDLRQGMLGRF
jgi:hypothetical protein